MELSETKEIVRELYDCYMLVYDPQTRCTEIPKKLRNLRQAKTVEKAK